MTHGWCIAGLLLGDEGKGKIVDALTRRIGASLVIRTGGCQAAHHVVTDDGRSHCFAQFGSGALAGARTHLSRFMFIEPVALIREAAHLEALGVRDPLSTLTVHPDAPVITPYQRALNRLRECLRGPRRHGSTGMGIGELADDLAHRAEILRMHELLCSKWAEEKLGHIRQRCCDTARRLVGDHVLSDDTVQYARGLYASPGAWLGEVRAMYEPFRFEQLTPELPVDDAPFIIEGSQGVLLDETYGFAPYHTWLDCTFGKADQLLVGTRWSADVTRLVVARTFLTRHGRGPLPTEDDALRPALVDDHNTTGPWQGALRVGHFDAVLARYALDVLAATGSAPTALALTHIDKVQPPWAMCLRYGQHSRLSPAASLTKFLMQVGQAGLKPHYARYESAGAFLNALEATLGLPLGIVSTGPEARSTAFPGLQ